MTLCVHFYLCNLPPKCSDGNNALMATRLCSRKTAHLHTAHVKQYTQHETPEFISTNLWPPNSRSCLCDYTIWGLCNMSMSTRHPPETPGSGSTVSLTRPYRKASSTTLLINADWITRLRTCIKAKGCHFEHLLHQTGSFQTHQQSAEENTPTPRTMIGFSHITTSLPQ